jgi:Flp pilus assembly protein TadG
MKRHRNERGAAIIEVALTLPLLLLVCVGIFEFGRAYMTQQVLTNAAREGARVAVLPNQPTGAAEARATQYMTNGQLPNAATATVSVTNTTISIGGTTTTGSRVTVNYPFSFAVLQPVARLVVGTSALGTALTMTATAEMRNEY